MRDPKDSQLVDVDNYHARWKDLYIVGGICGIGVSVLTVAAAIIYFIWPYQPGISSVSTIYETIRTDPFNGLMSLDFMMVVATFFIIPFFIAIYAATRNTNESYALIALVFGLISCVLIFVARPITEMFLLSEQYATATTDVLRNHYIAAGEALTKIFHGTVWHLYYLTFFIELLISSILMLKTKPFTKFTAYLGIAVNIGIIQVFVFIIPQIADIVTLTNLICTIIWTIWNVLVAKALFQLARSASGRYAKYSGIIEGSA